jgi:hypothetical protein
VEGDGGLFYPRRAATRQPRATPWVVARRRDDYRGDVLALKGRYNRATDVVSPFQG